MRLTLVTYGSEGDTRPFVGLSLALKAAGHEVHLLAGTSTIHNALSLGLSASELPGDIRSTLPLSRPHETLTRSDVLKAVRAGLRTVNENARLWMELVAARARQSDAVLYAGLALVAAESVADALDLPAIALWLQPTSPTREFAAPTTPWQRLPGWINRLSYRVSPEALMRRLYGGAVRQARRHLFGRTATRPRQRPRLYGFSPLLIPRPSDWPATDIVCGRWTQPVGNWQPPGPLREFLAAGEPPIYVGFGAISSFIRGPALGSIIAAVGGRRAVFQPGWSLIGATMLPDNFFVLDDTPHEWLFPQVSVIVHHAGAGTAQSAAASGIPSVPLPMGADQFFWANRLANAGIAPGSMPGTKIHAGTLAALTGRAADPTLRRRAAEVGAAIRQEDGVSEAVRQLGCLLERSP